MMHDDSSVGCVQTATTFRTDVMIAKIHYHVMFSRYLSVCTDDTLQVCASVYEV